MRKFPCAVSQVMLCANSRPALNDVTYNELTLVAKKVADICPVIKEALSSGRLIIMESGQGSPCLDLRWDIFRHGCTLGQLNGTFCYSLSDMLIMTCVRK